MPAFPGMPSPKMEAGHVRTSPAFGKINAGWLCHAVGVGFSALDETRIQSAFAMQLSLCLQIFRAAAEVGARSVAVPAVSGGKRGFPARAVAAIAAGVAACEVLASGGPSLDVYLVGFGAENHAAIFASAKQCVLAMLAPYRPGR